MDNFRNFLNSAGQSNGNLADDGILTYVYDAFNRLKQVKRKSDGAVIATYSYDAQNRRVQKVISNGGLTGDIPNDTIDFFYDGDQIVEEYDGTLSSPDAPPLRQYVWGRYIDELLQQREIKHAPAGRDYIDYYPLSDLLHRTVALTDDQICQPGSSGGPGGGIGSSLGPGIPLVEVYDTDPYGLTTIFTGPGPDGRWFSEDDVTGNNPRCRFLFTGREYDPETQIYYFRGRYYQPVLGRFISRDPLLFGAGSMGLYEYCGGNPLINTDPDGLISPVSAYQWSAYGQSLSKDVGAPGTKESFVPVWGSAREAVHDFQTGHWIWGLVNSGMAVSDLALIKSAVTDVGKLTFKGGGLLFRELGAMGARETGAVAAKDVATTAGKAAVRDAAAEVFASTRHATTEVGKVKWVRKGLFFFQPSFPDAAWEFTKAGEKLSEARKAAITAHELRHMADAAAHPWVTWFATRGFSAVVPGTGVARYFLEWRGYYKEFESPFFNPLRPLLSFEKLSHVVAIGKDMLIPPAAGIYVLNRIIKSLDEENSNP